MVTLGSLGRLQYGQNVLLNSQSTENTRFLRQVSKPEPCPRKDRQVGDLVCGLLHVANIRRQQANQNVECRRLAGPVWPQQPDSLAALELHRNVANDPLATEALADTTCHKSLLVRDQARTVQVA